MNIKVESDGMPGDQEGESEVNGIYPQFLMHHYEKTPGETPSTVGQDSEASHTIHTVTATGSDDAEHHRQTTFNQFDLCNKITPWSALEEVMLIEIYKEYGEQMRRRGKRGATSLWQFITDTLNTRCRDKGIEREKRCEQKVKDKFFNLSKKYKMLIKSKGIENFEDHNAHLKLFSELYISKARISFLPAESRRCGTQHNVDGDCVTEEKDPMSPPTSSVDASPPRLVFDDLDSSARSSNDHVIVINSRPSSPEETEIRVDSRPASEFPTIGLKRQRHESTGYPGSTQGIDNQPSPLAPSVPTDRETRSEKRQRYQSTGYLEKAPEISIQSSRLPPCVPTDRETGTEKRQRYQSTGYQEKAPEIAIQSSRLAPCVPREAIDEERQRSQPTGYPENAQAIAIQSSRLPPCVPREAIDEERQRSQPTGYPENAQAIAIQSSRLAPCVPREATQESTGYPAESAHEINNHSSHQAPCLQADRQVSRNGGKEMNGNMPSEDPPRQKKHKALNQDGCSHDERLLALLERQTELMEQAHRREELLIKMLQERDGNMNELFLKTIKELGSLIKKS